MGCSESFNNQIKGDVMRFKENLQIPIDTSVFVSIQAFHERIVKPLVEGIEAIRCSFDSSDLSLIGESGYEVANRLDIPCEGRSCCSIAFDIGAKLLLTREEIGRCTPCELEERARNWVAVDDYKRSDTLELIAVAIDRLLGEQDDMRPVVRQRPLSHTAERVAQFVRENPGKIGTEIAFALRISPEGVRQVFFHHLYYRGFKNRRYGQGYFPPEE